MNIEVQQYNTKCIYFGDYVLIRAQPFNRGKQSNIEGFINGLGKNDQNVYFQLLTDELIKDEQNTQNNPNGEGSNLINTIRNYRDLVFQIWPKCSSDAHREFRKIKKQIDILQKSITQKGKNQQQQDMLDNLELKLEDLKKRKQQEMENNYKLHEYFKQVEVVTYGSDIQLMHVDSKMFLDGRVVASSAEKSAFQFSLSDQFSNGMVFRILPKFKLRQIGEIIQYSDNLLILNAKLNSYINFKIDQPSIIDKPLEISENPKSYPLPDYRINDKKCFRYSTFLSLFSDISWQFNKHGEWPKQESSVRIIKGGDIIRLKHTEFPGYLSADISYEGSNPEIFLRNYTKEKTHPHEQYSISSLWEVEICQFKQRGSLCELKDEKNKVTTFRLRHFQTGRLLSMEQVNIKSIGGKQKQIPVLAKFQDDAKGGKDDNSSISFISTKKGKNLYINEGRCYNLLIKNQYTKLMEIQDNKDAKDSFLFYSYKDDPQNNIPNFFTRIKESDLYIQRAAIEIAQPGEKKEEDAYWIERVQEDFMNDVIFIRSTIPTVLRLVNIFKKTDMKKIDSELTDDFLESCLIQISNLILFVIETEDKDPFTCEGESIEGRQMLMRDMRYIELLTDLLYYPFHRKYLNLQNMKGIKSDLFKIFQLSYKLILFSIREYRPNEMFASQWFDFMMNQMINCDPQFDIQAEQTLTELIDNNQYVLDNKINEDVIKNIIELLIKQKNMKYLKLLRAFINCDGKAIPQNQQLISKLLFESSDPKFQNSYSILIYPLRETNDKIEIKVLDSWENLSTLQILSSSVEEYQKINAYDFYINTLLFLSDLCNQRNYIAIDKIIQRLDQEGPPKQILFPMHICEYIIINPIFNFEIRSAFAKIFLTSWIDGQSLEKLDYPNNFRIWKEIPSTFSQQIYKNKNSQIIQKFQQIKEFIVQFMTTQTKYLYQKHNNTEQNLFTQSILEIALYFIQYGFYNNLQEIKMLLLPIFKYLNSTMDVFTDDQEEERQVEIDLIRLKQSSFFQSSELRKRKKEIDILLQTKLRRNTLKQLKNSQTDFGDKYKENEDNKILITNRKLCTDIVKKAAEIRNDLRTSNFLIYFKKEYESKKFKNSDFSVLNQSSSLNKSSNNLMSEKALQLSQKLVQSPLKWIEQIITQGDLDFDKISLLDINSIFMDLFMYDNIEIQINAFQLILLHFSQRSSLVQYMKNINILDNQKKIQILNESKIIRKQLTDLSDRAEKWYGFSDEESLNNADLYLKLIDHLFNILIETDQEQDDIMKSNREITNKQYEFFEKFKDQSYIDEQVLQKIIKPDIQVFLKNLQIYEPIIVLIQYNLGLNKSLEEVRLSQTIIRRCYQFLSIFCFRDIQNQEILRNYQHLFQDHMLKQPDTSAYMIIQEINRNNKYVIKNSQTLESSLNTIFDSLEIIDFNNHLKAKHMNSLKIYMKIDNKVLKSNQIQIIMSMGSSKYKNIQILVYNDPKILAEFNKLCKEFSAQFGQSLSNLSGELIVPPILDYFISQLEIMSISSEDANASSESKCQSYFSIDNIISLFKMAGDCIPIKRILLYFFYHVYLQTEKEMDDSIDLIKELLKLANQELKFISDNYQQIQEGNFNIKSYQGSQKISQYIEFYLSKVILPIISMTIKKQIFYGDSNFKQFYINIMNSYIKLAKSSKTFSQKMNICQYIFQIETRGSIVSEIDYDLTFKPFIPEDCKLIIKDLEQNDKNSKDIQLETFETQMDESLESIFNWRINQILKNNKFQDLVDEEFITMIQLIKGIENITKDAFFGMNTLNFDQVVSKLIELVDPRKKQIDNGIIITTLTILRKIIELENLESKTPASDWDIDDYQEYSFKLIQKQEQLVELGCINIVCTIMGSDPDQSIFHEAILLSCSLLLGGNKKAQEKFYEYLQSDAQNNIINNLQKLIDSLFKDFKKSMTIKNKQRILQFQQIVTDNSEQITHDNLRRIYRFLQLLCEGHYLDMQKFFCKQCQGGVLNGRSVNLINHTCMKFQNYLRFINNDCIDLGNQIVDFLIESVQGPCIENQKQLLNSRIVEIVSELLTMFNQTEYQRRGFTDEDQQNEVNKLISKSQKIFLTLLEGNLNGEISKILNDSLDFNKISQKISNEFQVFCKQVLNMDPLSDINSLHDQMLYKIVSYDGNISEAFNMFLVLKNIDSLLTRYNYKDNLARQCLEDQSNQLETQAKQFLEMNTSNVEVFIKDQLHRIYFPIQPTCFNLSKFSRSKLMMEVKRDSPNDKISGLIAEKPAMYTEMEHLTWLKSFYFQVTSQKLDLSRTLSTLVAFIINILLIIIFYREQNDKTSYINNNSSFYGLISSSFLIFILGLIQLILSLTMLVLWIIINGPIIKRVHWDRFVESNQYQVNEKLEEELMDFPDLKTLETKKTIYLLRTKGPYSEFFQVKGELQLGHFYTRLYYYEKTFMFYLSEPSLVYMLFYIVCAIFGFYINPIMYCLHLLEVINRFPMLRNVILSITTNVKQLALTFFLGLIIMYIYAVIGYFFLNADFFNSAIPPAGENMCQNLLICYLWLIDYGLRNGGGISESMRMMSFNSDNLARYFVRFVYDISYFAVITVVFLNIIFGIIIDTFGHLRDERSSIYEDMKNKCYICGLNRQLLDKDAQGFDSHIDKDHQLWNYLYYMYYLDTKDKTEYDGIESIIQDLNENSDISWFPIMKTIALGDNKEESNILEQLQEKILVIQQLSNDIQKLQ